MENLTSSIRERGVLQPIRVWFRVDVERYQIIAGERRYRAATAAGLPNVPCLVEDVPANHSAKQKAEILVEQISENWQRADLKPLELSNALQELSTALDMGPRDLAKHLSKPESEVSRLLSLQQIDPALRHDLKSSSEPMLSRRHLIAVAQLPAAEQAPFVESVRDRKLTARETEQEVSRLRGGKSTRATDTQRGTSRRFVIGNATVEVRFRKRNATDTDVLDALERAARLLREQKSGEAA